MIELSTGGFLAVAGIGALGGLALAGLALGLWMARGRE